MQPTTDRPTELRYRIADFINDRLKVLPGIHAAAKAAIASLVHDRPADGEGQEPAAPTPNVSVEESALPEASASPKQQDEPVTSERSRDVSSEAAAPASQVSLDNLPLPPFEMRELVGPTDPAAFDNPSGMPVYDYLAPSVYEKVFDFGCGCGRVARQLMLQRPSPRRYVGVDLHLGMIRWCQQNLQPAAPNFSFLHHDVYNVRFNPNPDAPAMATFPAGDAQFTLVNALSVFTHLTAEQAVHYLGECARILHAEGVLHASWLLFDKKELSWMRPETPALYVSYLDPSAAVMFDREWVRTTARQVGLRIYSIVPPYQRGNQWVLMMTKRQGLPEPEFPPDTAPYSDASPPRGARWDLSRIGLEE